VGFRKTATSVAFNPLNAELNPICHLLALLGVHHFLHVSRIRVKVKASDTDLKNAKIYEMTPSPWSTHIRQP
jgi:hypothetical protein